MIGKTLGHYQITEKLGVGGMGVVYKARDLHLDRFVALKILPPEKVVDTDRKRRFVQEAKAASALNHPNIVHVYDIDQSEGTDYIAMEYVEGRTLDQQIGRRGLPLNDALKFAVQIADALAKAHSAGIVHRDLKPTNIMVNEDGMVKVLDFGLAKLTEWVQGDQFASTATIDDEGRPVTEEGVIVGTVSYMSPEQAEGKKVDARSDIFSLGSVLYEMVTGQKAFQGSSKMSTLSAILHQEPKPVSGIMPAIPAELERLINRCLRKDPAKRFQHMDDVKVALDEVKEDSESGRLQISPAAAKRVWPMRLAVLVVGVAVLIAASWYWLRPQRTAEPEVALTAAPLTSYPGFENIPSFSPDGNYVAFQWCKDGPSANCDIYSKQIDIEPPQQLTTDPADDFSPAWSPDGRFIAFLRQRAPASAAVMLIPRVGGQERMLGEADPLGREYLTPDLAWTPDSKWLVFPSTESGTPDKGLFILSVDTLQKRRLTTPPAGSAGDTAPALSPDGRTLAFTRWRGVAADVYLLRLGENYEPQGAPETVAATGEQICSSAAWTPDGREIVFLSGAFTSGGLWRAAATKSAKPRKLAVTLEDVWALAVSRQGNRLAYTMPQYNYDIWRVDLRDPDRKPGTPFKVFASTRNESGPAYSPDGKRIAFNSDRSGHIEVWVCNSDGSNAVQLTSLGAVRALDPRWSPDGQSIVFGGMFKNSGDIYIVNVSGGPPRRLTNGLPSDLPFPFWSRDGQSIYFRSKRSGRDEIWKMPAAGGEAMQITRNGGDMPQESPDGKLLYFVKGDNYPERCSVWRTPAGGGEETVVLDSTACDLPYVVVQQGIYFITPKDKQSSGDISYYDFSSRTTRKIVAVEGAQYIAASPDGRTILYTKQDEPGSDLMLVENFR